MRSETPLQPLRLFLKVSQISNTHGMSCCVRETVNGRTHNHTTWPHNHTTTQPHKRMATLNTCFVAFAVFMPRFRDSGRPRGFAFVVFETVEDAREAAEVRVVRARKLQPFALASLQE